MSKNTPMTTRRAVLRNGMAVASATLVAGSPATAAKTNGKLVFTYDDGPIKDFTHTYQKAHRKEGVPGCSAVPAASVGQNEKLSAAQLRTLEDAGWEIMSHSARHRALGDIEITRDIDPADQKLYVKTNVHGKIPDDTLIVSDGSESTTVTVAGNGSDDHGEFVKLDSPVGQAFTASDGVTERYTDDILRYALGESRQQLEQHGVTVTNIVMPYGGYGKRTQELAGEYYTAVANGGLAIGGRAQIHQANTIQLPHLSRAMFRQGEMTEAELGTFLDKVATADTLGILGGHSWWQERLPPSRIRMAIQMAKDRNIDIVTLRDALTDLGLTNSSRASTTDISQTSSSGGGINKTQPDDSFASGEDDGSTAQATTTETNQPGFEGIAALVGIGSAAALRRRLNE
ncbi:polysaccharide deacetylase family protein [Haladaptatus caseinilyticus]|uniref:polysaccharide deacetylase family protein n=1 Tax=Haladaptatus caseinilyticus TaxID=2993314 RepID=UPI00224B4977|nr:polysaccharide deacetylase family protein [Haladaptatus caseinilyticus]